MEIIRLTAVSDIPTPLSMEVVMNNGIKAVEMTPSEHVYFIELDGTSVLFRDRGVFGEVEEGVDFVELLPESSEAQPCAKGDCLDALIKDLYGSEIKGYVSSFRQGLPTVTKRVYDDVHKTWDGMIGLNFNHWCGRENNRVPYAQHISLLHTDNLSHVQLSDYSGDGKVDEAMFTTEGEIRIRISSFEQGQDTVIWDGSIKPCYDVDQSRYGLETFLNGFDALFTKGWMREL